MLSVKFESCEDSVKCRQPSICPVANLSSAVCTEVKLRLDVTAQSSCMWGTRMFTRTRVSWCCRALLCISDRCGWMSDLPYRCLHRCLSGASCSSHLHLCRENSSRTWRLCVFALITRYVTPPPTSAVCPWLSGGTSWRRFGPGPSCSCLWRWRQRGALSYRETVRQTPDQFS